MNEVPQRKWGTESTCIATHVTQEAPEGPKEGPKAGPAGDSEVTQKVGFEKPTFRDNLKAPEGHQGTPEGRGAPKDALENTPEQLPRTHGYPRSILGVPVAPKKGGTFPSEKSATFYIRIYVYTYMYIYVYMYVYT